MERWYVDADFLHRQWSATSQNVSCHANPSVFLYCTEPPFTNYTEKFKGTLDYLFIPRSHTHLIPRAILEIPSETSVSAHTALPDDTLSSDHVSIACLFELKI